MQPPPLPKRRRPAPAGRAAFGVASAAAIAAPPPAHVPCPAPLRWLLTLAAAAIATLLPVLTPAAHAQAPAAPTNFSVNTYPTTTSVKLEWYDRSTNEDGFTIERKGENDADFVPIVTTGTANGANNWMYHTDASLPLDSQFSYRIKAVNTSGSSAYAGPITAATAPVPPINVAATTESDSAIKITWTDDSRYETHFYLYRKAPGETTFSKVKEVAGSATGVKGGSFSITDTSLAPNASYAYYVLARNGAGNSAQSEQVAATTAVAANPPAAPSSLQINEYQNNGLAARMMWVDNSFNESSFELEVRQAGQTGFGPAGSFPTTNMVGTNYWFYQTGNSPMAQDDKYEFRVRAVNGAGGSAYSNIYPVYSKPNTPTFFSAEAVSDTSIKLTWTDASKYETDFALYRRKVGTTSWSGVIWTGKSSPVTGTGGQFTYTDTGLLASTDYEYQLAAYNNQSGGVYSDRTATAAARTQDNQRTPTAPSSLQNGEYQDNGLAARMMWVDNSDNESSFVLESKLDSATTYDVVGTFPTTNMAGTGYWFYQTGNSPMTIDEKYNFRVKAINNAGASAYSNIYAVYSKPNMPTGFSAEAVSDTSIKLTWTDASKYETNFGVYRRKKGTTSWSGVTWTNKATAGTGTQLTYTDTGLLASTDYEYELVAYNGDSGGVYSDRTSTVSARTQDNQRLPAAPSSLTNDDYQNNGLAARLRWVDNSDNESSFVLESKLDSATTYDVVGTFPTTNMVGTGYWFYQTGNSPMTIDEKYNFRVKAINGVGSSAYNGPINVYSKPNTPTGLTAQGFSTTQIRLRWTDASKYETNFGVYRRKKGTATWSNVIWVGQTGTGTGSTITWDDSGLTANTEYEYQVVAYNGDSSGVYSDKTDIVSGSTFPTNPPGAPSNLIATPVQTEIKLSWNDNSLDEFSFTVERKMEGETAFQFLASAPAQAGVSLYNTFSDKGLTKDTLYTYRVKAVNPAGDSAYSNEASAATVPVAPTGLSGDPVAGGSSQIKLTWTDKSRHEEGFYIHRRRGGTSDAFVNIGFVLAKAGTDLVAEYTDNSLLPATAYEYKVTAYNAAGESDAAGPITVSTNSNDNVAPDTFLLTGPANNGRLCDATTATWTFTGSDDQASAAQLKYQWRIDGGAWSAVSSTTTATVNGLTDGAHTFEVRAIDPASNVDATPATSTFTVDTVALTITGVQTSGITQTGATVAWTTNKPASTIVEYRAQGAANWSQKTGADNVTSHTVTLTNLAMGTTYEVRVRSADGGCHDVTVDAGTFTTMPFVDTTAPDTQITGGPADGGAVCEPNVTFTWKATDNVPSGITFSYRVDGGAWSDWSASTTATVGPFTAGSTHSFEVRAKDAAGNIDATPAKRTFKIGDAKVPVITDITADPRDVKAIITWSTDVPTTSQVEYGLNSGLGQATVRDNNRVTFHRVVVTGLTPQTQYFFRVKSNDDCHEVILDGGSFTTTSQLFPNLTITQLSVPQSLTAGIATSVSWTVQNVGMGDVASKTWKDTVYLSTTPTLGSDAVVIGTFNSTNRTLESAAAYSGSVSFTVPFTVAPGPYYVIVKTDSENTGVGESDETDNTRFAATSVVQGKVFVSNPDVVTRTLKVNQPVQVQIALGNIGPNALTGIVGSFSGLAANVEAKFDFVPTSLASLTSNTALLTLNAKDASAIGNNARVVFTTSTNEVAIVDLRLTITPPTPRLTLNTSGFTAGMLRGKQTLVEAEIENTGDVAAENVAIQLPGNAAWMSLATPFEAATFQPGEKAKIVLSLNPAVDLPLGPYQGSILVKATNAQGLSIPFAFNNTSDAKGGLRVAVEDEFTYFAPDRPGVSGAKVFLRNAYTSAIVAQGVSDGTGVWFGDAIAEGTYNLEVTAEKHGTYRGPVTIVGGINKDQKAFLPRELVTYQWTVFPVPFEDKYEISLEAKFETNVPAPVVTITPKQLDLSTVNFNASGKATVYYTVTNHGLVAADKAELTFPTNMDYTFTAAIEKLGKLAPLSTLIVPVTIQKKNVGAPGGGSGQSLASFGAAAGAGYVSPSRVLPGFESDERLAAAAAAQQNSPFGLAGRTAALTGPSGGSGSDGGGAKCAGDLELAYKFLCGDEQARNDVSKIVDKCLSYVPGWGNSTGGPADPFPYSGVTWGGNGFPGDGKGAWSWFSDHPYVEQPGLCDECKMRTLLAIAQCAPAAKDGVECAAGASEAAAACGASTSTGPGAILGCLGGAGYAGYKCYGAAKDLYECAQKAGAAAGSCSGGGPPAPIGGGSGSGTSSVLNTVSSGGGVVIPAPLSPAVQNLYAKMARLQAHLSYWTLVFGDTKWANPPAAEKTATYTIGSAFMDAIQTGSAGQERVTDAERQTILGLTRPASISQVDVERMIDRWNRTADYYAANILEVTDVPAGQSTDFIPISLIRTSAQTAVNAAQADINDGFVNIGDSTEQAMNLLKAEILQPKEEGICATVKIRLDQTAALTRTGFKANLELVNKPQNVELKNLKVVLTITDDQGNDKTGVFAIAAPVVTGTGNVTGTGTVAPGTTATASWFMVPTREAAPEVPTNYYVGGTLSYMEGTTEVVIPLFSTGILVKPDPFLKLDYFWQRDVYGDDPFTAEIEAAEPFSLGLLVRNTGKGTAFNMNIESAQPKIVDNEKGLAVNFKIIGSQVNDKEINPSLTVNLGSIDPEQTATARWLMTSSVQGKFVEYAASFKHVNPLGVGQTSVIDTVNIHELDHVVRAQSPTDDGKPDFLANDVVDTEKLPDHVYLSDSATPAVVQPVTAGVVDAPVSNTRLTVQLSLGSVPAGHVYVRIDDPGAGKYRLMKVTRSDGKVIRLEDNAWLTHRVVRLQNQAPQVQNRLHLYDQNSTGQYTLLYAVVTGTGTPGALKQLADGTPVVLGGGGGSGGGDGSGGSGGNGGSGDGSGGNGGNGGGGGGIGDAGAVAVTAVFPTEGANGSVYVEALDRSSGIKVAKPINAPALKVGDRVTASGVIKTDAANSERYVEATQIAVAATGEAPAALGIASKPLYAGDFFYDPSTGAGQKGMDNGAGLNPVGLLARSRGKVTQVSAGAFLIDDGYGRPAKVLLPAGAAAPAVGMWAQVTGVVSVEKGTGANSSKLYPVLRARTAEDVVALDPAADSTLFQSPAGALGIGENQFSLPGIPVDARPTAVLSAWNLNGNLTRYDAVGQAEVFFASATPDLFGGMLVNEGYRMGIEAGQPTGFQFIGFGADHADAWVSLPKLGAARIGHPYTFPVEWASVQVSDGIKVVTLNEAAKVAFPAWLGATASYRDNAAQAARTLGLPGEPTANDTKLRPWTGYTLTSQRNNIALIVPTVAAPAAPQVTTISPNASAPGGPAFTLVVNGSNFRPQSVVLWNGQPRPTTFVSETQLTAAIPAGDIAESGLKVVTVYTSPASNGGGGGSNPAAFTVGAARLVYSDVTGMSRSNANGTITATIAITNSGTIPAVNARLTSAAFGSLNAPANLLPMNLGTINAGQTKFVTITFGPSGTLPASGALVWVKVAGAWDGGLFTGNRRVPAP
jgi:hypothetical protein